MLAAITLTSLAALSPIRPITGRSVTVLAAYDSARSAHTHVQDHLTRRARPAGRPIADREDHRKHRTAPRLDHTHGLVTIDQHMRPIVQRRQHPQQRPRQARTAHAAALPVVSTADLPDAGLPAAATSTDTPSGAFMPVARMVHVSHLA